MQTVINLNDWIKVKLTPYGQQIYYAHFLNFHITPPRLKIDDEGYTRFQLWSFIEMFGSYIYMGAKNVIEPLEIIKEIEE